MAGPLPCDNHPDRFAATLITDLETGNTLTLCQDCFMNFAEMLCGISDMPSAEVAELVESAQEVADLEPATPAPDAGPKSAPEPATPPAQDEERRADATEEATAPGE